ncbi:YacL family protein [Vibrio astriarenae]
MMDFEFKKNTLLGTYTVYCSMGHEAVAQWVESELGTEITNIDKHLDLLEQARISPYKEINLLGQGYSLSIYDNEVTIKANTVQDESDDWHDEELGSYSNETESVCGLDDFESLLVQWRDFIG